MARAAPSPEDAVWPQKTYYRYQDVKGRHIFFREAGDAGAPTILLLHGFPTTSHAYRELIALLSGRYHVIAPDYLGSGFSEKPDPGEVTYTFDLLAEYVNGLVAARGIDKYVLYMHFGGPVGFRVMLSHGPRLRIPYRTNPGLRRLIGRPARPVATADTDEAMVAPCEWAIVYVEIDLREASVPSSIRHRVEYRTKGEAATAHVEGAHVAIPSQLWAPPGAYL